MSSNNKKRQILFDKYAQNWAMVKKHPLVHIKKDIEDAFLCPICLGIFARECLEKREVTLEHIPPESLGGKLCTLTCKFCNNFAGSKLDSQLLQNHRDRAFLKDIVGAQKSIRIGFGKGHPMGAEISVTEDGWQLIPIKKQSTPQAIPEMNEMFKNEDVLFNMKLSLTDNTYVDVALLRIAYLYCFERLGYTLLFHKSLEIVREQIRNPHKKLCDTYFTFDKRMPDAALGISVLEEPEEMQSFMVVFDLEEGKSGFVSRCIVFLPAFNRDIAKPFQQFQESKNLAFNASPINSDFDMNFAPLTVINSLINKNNFG